MTWPGEALLIKLWETLVEKGVGGLLKPWQIKREALAHTDARRTELVALADAEREADEIRSGRLKLSNSRYALALSPPVTPAKDLRKTALEGRSPVEVSTSALISDALRREVNVAKAITYAESELKDDSQKPPKRNIDSDWLYRWRDYAGTVSSEELQSIWGRLLAGELKSPGSYSYRTLDFVRNLTTDEAKKIEQVSRFVITNFISKEQAPLLQEDGISFSDLIELQNLGVLSGVEGALALTLKSTREDRFENVLRSHGRALLVTHDDPQKQLMLKVYLVTALGQQVLRLGKFDPHEKYLQAVGEELKKAGTVVTIGDYRATSENEFQFVKQRQL
jgi:Protein of unknown function (DUF2806)